MRNEAEVGVAVVVPLDEAVVAAAEEVVVKH